MGRPKAGLDYDKITFRTAEKQSQIVGQYCRDHEKPEPSTAVRAAIDLLGASMELSDIIETSCANLLDIAKVFDSIQGENAPIYAESIREAATLLWVFCYKEHLPDKRQLEEQRHKRVERYIKQSRKE